MKDGLNPDIPQFEHVIRDRIQRVDVSKQAWLMSQLGSIASVWAMTADFFFTPMNEHRHRPANSDGLKNVSPPVAITSAGIP